MSPTLKQRWLDHFRACGYPDATGIATGVEGAAYSLVPGELVAKTMVTFAGVSRCWAAAMCAVL